MRTKRLLTLLLAALLLTSCGEGTTDTTDETTTNDVQTSETTPETTYMDTLGEKDFGGATYTYMYAERNASISILDPHVGEMTGEIMNDTLYTRDKWIEETYGVSIDYLQDGDMANSVRNAVQAGDTICNVMVGSLNNGSSLLGASVTMGILYNLLDVPYLQPDKDWWSPLMYENVQYNGKMFFTSGDMAPFSYIGPACVYMNLNLAENYHVDEDEIYDLVYDGKWTFDELYSRYNGLDTDLNGDGKMHCLDDFYGIVTEYNTLTSTLLLVANDIKLCETDDSGKLAIHLNDERTVSVIDKMAKYFQKIENNGDNTLLFDQTFKYDRALFAIHYVESTLRRFRDMDSDYVILPMPKYNDIQESYVCYINPWVQGFIGIPLVVEDIEMTGFVTEVMEYKSVEMVRPAVYDVTLKGKALRNEDSLAMLDIVFDTTYIDFNGIYEFGGLLGAVNSAVFYDKPYASAYAAAEEKAKAALETFMEIFE